MACGQEARRRLMSRLLLFKISDLASPPHQLTGIDQEVLVDNSTYSLCGYWVGGGHRELRFLSSSLANWLGESEDPYLGSKVQGRGFMHAALRERRGQDFIGGGGATLFKELRRSSPTMFLGHCFCKRP